MAMEKKIMRAFDGMAMHDLSNGMKVGESAIHSAALESAEISWIRKMAFGNQDFSSDFLGQSNQNSRESGEHPYTIYRTKGLIEAMYASVDISKVPYLRDALV
ncbi:hypothetical protein RND71_037605 [Anisodus tanguticus]|uniref:Uncharacterized protein n=1 Tax=Anisodus tanguticus TaxID=243964 RepID=A0AAE1QXE0_9SOLA|nr:hypothetical protein RND71_037605 [Anisodus tanguticus]